jgi:hypothetical protein
MSWPRTKSASWTLPHRCQSIMQSGLAGFVPFPLRTTMYELSILHIVATIEAVQDCFKATSVSGNSAEALAYAPDLTIETNVVLPARLVLPAREEIMYASKRVTTACWLAACSSVTAPASLES